MTAKEMAKLVRKMQRQERIDKAAARVRWDAMSDAEKEARKIQCRHMDDKMQSSEGGTIFSYPATQ